MKTYHSINKFSRVNAEQMADIIERFSNGESFESIAEFYKVARSTIFHYIHKNLYGIIPKERQKTITLRSKVNDE